MFVMVQQANEHITLTLATDQGRGCLGYTWFYDGRWQGFSQGFFVWRKHRLVDGRARLADKLGLLGRWHG